jgi:hypothetical protein
LNKKIFKEGILYLYLIKIYFMLEIILLIFLSKKIGDKADRKGLKRGQWQFITVATWIGCEFLGAIIAVMLFGFDKSNLLGLEAFALACAFGGYLLVKASIDKKPDDTNDDIENIGKYS